MTLFWRTAWLLLACAPALAAAAQERVVYEVTSAYHHIRVTEAQGIRTLNFDDAQETRMSVQDPLKGHFEYTEYFHMAWLWNTQLAGVLMIGLGGGSAQRSFEHYYPAVRVETVEIDPAVLRVARDYFNFKESERQRVHLEDGRMFLRRSRSVYDLIIFDAYVQGRYGSSLPQHLATRECFQLARDRLSTNGVLAYNVIGTLSGYRANLVGALYRTLKSVFPQVYIFPARTSQNLVLVATKAGIKAERSALRQRASLLVQSRRITLPGFLQRFEVFDDRPPPNASVCPILSDDYAPVEGLAAAP